MVIYLFMLINDKVLKSAKIILWKFNKKRRTLLFLVILFHTSRMFWHIHKLLFLLFFMTIIIIQENKFHSISIFNVFVHVKRGLNQTNSHENTSYDVSLWGCFILKNSRKVNHYEIPKKPCAETTYVVRHDSFDPSLVCISA